MAAGVALGVGLAVVAAGVALGVDFAAAVSLVDGVEVDVFPI